MKNLNVVLNMSGCELSKHLCDIGFDNIKMAADNDKLLAEYSDEELIDEMVNNNNRDHKDIIVALVKSNILDDDDEQYGLIDRLEGFLKDIGLE